MGQNDTEPGVILGKDSETGAEITLTQEARRLGVYVMGTTGTGKTTLLKRIAVQDMEAGAGLCVLDPHGDLTDELLALVPKWREPEVILFAPGDKKHQYEYPLGLNIFACDRSDPQQRDLVASTVISTLKKLFSYSWGPRMEDLLRSGILTLMDWEDSTFLDLWLLLALPDYRVYYTQTGKVTSSYLRKFWQVFSQYSPHDRAEIVGSSLNKIGRFLSNPVVRNIVSQPESAFDMREIMDTGKILFCNLAKGDLGEDNSSLFGAVLVNLILIAALQRRDVPPRERKLFHLIVDEYQSFATESFPTLQSEARKYAIDVIVAHQYRDQLDELNKGSTLNVANLLVLRVSGKDSFELASQFDNTPPEPEVKMEPVYRQVTAIDGKPIFVERKDPPTKTKQFHEVEQPQRLYSDVAAERANQLSLLPGLVALCRLLEEDKQHKKKRLVLVEHEIEIEPIEWEREPDFDQAERIREQSRARGRPRAEIEAMVDAKTERTLIFDEALPPARA